MFFKKSSLYYILYGFFLINFQNSNQILNEEIPNYGPSVPSVPTEAFQFFKISSPAPAPKPTENINFQAIRNQWNAQKNADKRDKLKNNITPVIVFGLIFCVLAFWVFIFDLVMGILFFFQEKRFKNLESIKKIQKNEVELPLKKQVINAIVKNDQERFKDVYKLIKQAVGG